MKSMILNAFPIPLRTPEAESRALLLPSRSFSLLLLLSLANAAFLLFLLSSSSLYWPLRASSIDPDILAIFSILILIFSKPILLPSVCSLGSLTLIGGDLIIALTPPPSSTFTRAPPFLLPPPDDSTLSLPFFFLFLIKSFALLLILSLAVFFNVLVAAFLAPCANKPFANPDRNIAILYYQTID